MNSTNTVFIQSGSNLNENENNFIRDIVANNATEICEGIFMESPGSDCVENLTCEGVCMLINGTSCLAGTDTILSSQPSMSSLPSTLPTISSYPTTSSHPTIEGTVSESPSMSPILPRYNDWNNLTLDIENASMNDTAKTFIIQPGSILQSINPITINSTGIIIECGDRIDRNARCIIEGGSSQFIITDSARSVQLIGLSFINGDGVSIIAAGDVDSDVTFVDCEWFVSRFGQKE